MMQAGGYLNGVVHGGSSSSTASAAQGFLGFLSFRLPGFLPLFVKVPLFEVSGIQ